MATVRQLHKIRSDPAAGGFYTAKEAARLLGLANAARVTAWLQGRKGTSLGPVLVRQYEPIATSQDVGFWDLLEVRFVDHFRRQGVSLQALRKAAQTARERWNEQHPFATSKAKYLTDRKHIFELTARETGDDILLDLVTRQYAIYLVLEDTLGRGIVFDPATGLAKEWRPRPKDFPDVAMNPTIAFGQPIIVPAGIPTSAIYRTWKAESGNYSAVCDWYGVDAAVAKQAVEFELGLPN